MNAAHVLVTGASGFLGSAVVRHLLAQGFQVTAMTDNPDRLSTRTGGLNVATCSRGKLPYAVPDCCVHCGWYAEPSDYHTSIQNVSSLARTLELAADLATAGCDRFVGVGTCFEYASSTQHLSESSAISPLTFYAETKHAAHTLLRRLPAAQRVAWARMFYLYGPWEPTSRLVPTVIRSLLADENVPLTRGDQVRDYMHVDDAAAALTAIALSNLEGAVNVASGCCVAVREIAGTIGNLMGRPERLQFGALTAREGEPARVCADISRLESSGWVPRYTLHAGLTSTIAWWRNAA